jgi:hypothetical protein
MTTLAFFNLKTFKYVQSNGLVLTAMDLTSSVFSKKKKKKPLADRMCAMLAVLTKHMHERLSLAEIPLMWQSTEMTIQTQQQAKTGSL